MTHRSRAAFRRTMRELLVLAWPIATAMAGETLMGVVDTKLVSGLGSAALGGVGVAMTVAFLGYVTTFGLMRGVKVAVAHAVGEGRQRDGVRYAQAGMALGAGAGAMFWAMTRDASPLFRALGTDPALVPYASAFLATFTWGAPAAAVVSALTQYRQAMGDSRTPMAVSLLGNAVNAGLGWALIYGHCGLPALGVRGGAWATVGCETLEAIALVALLVPERRRVGRAERAMQRRPDLSIGAALGNVAGLGVPTGLQFGSEMLAMVVFTGVLGSLGAEEVAAHQIALATIRMSFLPGVAIAEAASVLVGRALGRRSLDEVDRTARAAVAVAVCFMTGCGLVFAVGGGAIARAFTDDAVVRHIAQHLLWIAALFQTVDAIAIVFRGTLRGAKDVRVPALFGIVAIWVCAPTAAIVLGRRLRWGAAGGWFGFLAETTLGAILFSWRWRSGAWRRAGGATVRSARREAYSPVASPASSNAPSALSAASPKSEESRPVPASASRGRATSAASEASSAAASAASARASLASGAAPSGDEPPSAASDPEASGDPESLEPPPLTVASGDPASPASLVAPSPASLVAPSPPSFELPSAEAPSCASPPASVGTGTALSSPLPQPAAAKSKSEIPTIL